MVAVVAVVPVVLLENRVPWVSALPVLIGILLGIMSNRKTIKRNGKGKEICFPQGKTRTGCADRLCANAIGYAKHRSAPHDAVIRVHDDAGNVIEPHEQKGDFKEW